jgi:hypothetical protein
LLCSLLLRSVGPKSGVSTGVWNQGFEHLAHLDCLVDLDLKRSGVDDSGLQRIVEGCPGLERLTISFCDCLSPAGLWHLGKLPFLSYLDMSEWAGHQLCGPWRDSFLDGLVHRVSTALVHRLNRANAIEEGEENEEEDEEGSLNDGVFSLEYLDLTSTAEFGLGGKPGPNICALRVAGVDVKMSDA